MRKHSFAYSLLICSGLFSAWMSPAYSADRNLSLGERIDQLERAAEARGRSQVALVQQVDELQSELREMRGVTEEHDYKLSQILQRQRELYQELDRLSQLIKSGQNMVNNQVGSQQPQGSGFQINTNPSQSNDYAANLDENQAYDRAVNLVLKDKRYDQAIPEFENFLRQYPNSSYQPNARYWLGQLLFTKGELAQAQTHFSVVADQYPDSTKRADALLKLGMIASKQGNTAVAKQKYQVLLAEYPDSTPARLARTRLAEIE
ncbi:tol-pal system protein YbgF [Gayadomonas joobiniege]|uniref:tol-pal system protein YbgF n=1 Tax=Gayadomonas joobiniege TaxID=1234606 RepID=UPI0003653B8F|nr:tol-pal system protein YbgF [Gayadomonas joobiniege]